MSGHPLALSARPGVGRLLGLRRAANSAPVRRLHSTNTTWALHTRPCNALAPALRESGKPSGDTRKLSRLGSSPYFVHCDAQNLAGGLMRLTIWKRTQCMTQADATQPIDATHTNPTHRACGTHRQATQLANATHTHTTHDTHATHRNATHLANATHANAAQQSISGNATHWGTPLERESHNARDASLCNARLWISLAKRTTARPQDTRKTLEGSVCGTERPCLLFVLVAFERWAYIAGVLCLYYGTLTAKMGFPQISRLTCAAKHNGSSRGSTCRRPI
jgi:hypothetical protein